MSADVAFLSAGWLVYRRDFGRRSGGYEVRGIVSDVFCDDEMTQRQHEPLHLGDIVVGVFLNQVCLVVSNP